LKNNQGNSSLAQYGGARAGAGRPKGRVSHVTLEMKHTFEEMARQHAPACLNRLLELALNPKGDERAAVQACKLIIDRGFGSAIQRIEEGNPGDFSDLSDEEVNERAEEIARRVIAASRGAKAAKRGGKPRGTP
jgi:hypothetical protein